MTARPASLAIVDYGMGNLHSVRNAFSRLGAQASVIVDPNQLRDADAIVLPGVGAFGEAMSNLTKTGFVRALADAVLTRKTPYLGICLGMQLLAKSSTEMGNHDGLGWLDARVENIHASPSNPVPHVSWNTLVTRQDGPLFARISLSDTFYFDHSYQFSPCSEGVKAYTEYNGVIPSVVASGNIFATQFHPEKSQRSGLILLRNFLNILDDGRWAA